MPASRPQLEVADILRTHGHDFERAHRATSGQRAVVRHIVQCRTAALGGHVDECTSCGRVRISYNSCRDRHCPKCQCLRKAEWLESRCRHLLPIPYWHVVFTLPAQLHSLALSNRRSLYDLLFDSAARALQQIAGDPKHLGGEIGFTAVLHTWNQNLGFHPHLHCVVTGGGLDQRRQRWIPARDRFFLPVKVLGQLFRGKLLDSLREAHHRDQLRLDGAAAELAHPVAWDDLLDQLYRLDWVVYAKPPFAGPEHVFRYLGRYTHRIAIANHRLVSLGNGRVQFHSRGRAEDEKVRIVELSAVEFIRRFLLHVLPKRFVRIRHYGLLGARNVGTKLKSARRILDRVVPGARAALSPIASKAPWWRRLLRLTGIDVMACPYCSQGRLVRTRELVPAARPP